MKFPSFGSPEINTRCLHNDITICTLTRRKISLVSFCVPGGRQLPSRDPRMIEISAEELTTQLVLALAADHEIHDGISDFTIIKFTTIIS